MLPTAVYMAAILLALAGRFVMRFFDGIFALLFMLSPLVAAFTVVVAVQLNRERNHDGVWFAILMLLPLAFMSYIVIGWLLYGIALQP